MPDEQPTHHLIAKASPEPPLPPGAVGSKASGLMQMVAAGLPVPPAVVLPTSVYRDYRNGGWAPRLDSAVREAVADLERTVGRRLGRGEVPLLVSLRSGAPVSMPGMMDTVLNVGLTDAATSQLAAATGDGAFADDCRIRFLRAYGTTVSGLDPELVDRSLRRALELGTDPNAALGEIGGAAPNDPMEQVVAGVKAVFDSWGSERAVAFRNREGIDDGLGTSATIQVMVFGNLGDRSGTGVAFSRDPSTGEAGLVGDFLQGAQGEDIVAGTHLTRPLSDMAALWPDRFGELVDAARQLEVLTADMVDIEFTVEQGTLYLLQTRRGRRSPVAALRIAIDMADDATLPVDRADAVERCRALIAEAPAVSAPLHPDIVERDTIAAGLAASPGRAIGRLTLSIDDAFTRTEAGEAVVLVRPETSPSDVAGMAVAAGIVTTRGGLVSHAAVVARSWALPAVVGAESLVLGVDGVLGDGGRVADGEIVTVDGDAGLLLRCAHAGESYEPPELAVLRRWADELHSQVTGVPAGGPSDQTGAIEPLDVLRCLVLRGRVDAASLAEPLGAGQDAVEAVLAQLGTDELVATTGPFIMPTPAGRELVDRAFRAEIDRHGPGFAALLDRFVVVDGALKHVVTSWQLREDGSPNDHLDPDYDRSVVTRLRADVHVHAVPVVGSAAELIHRFERYGTRLERALDLLDAGDSRYMANPRLDSYHTVWFELHEEIIRLAGTDRATETLAGRA